MSSKACRVVRGLGSAATAARSIGESTVPGEILIPRIFSGASSIAIACVRAIRAPRVAEYAARPDSQLTPVIDAIRRITPPATSCI